MSNRLSWQQKLNILQRFGSASLHMRKPGDWFVAQDIGIYSNGLLEGRYGNGNTPKRAVEQHWKLLTNLQDGEYIVVINAHSHSRQEYRWNGRMFVMAS